MILLSDPDKEKENGKSSAEFREGDFDDDDEHSISGSGERSGSGSGSGSGSAGNEEKSLTFQNLLLTTKQPKKKRENKSEKMNFERLITSSDSSR